jgi:hypothetical protein
MASKRNPVRGENSALDRVFRIGSPSVADVLPPQLIHQAAQSGRQLGILGAKVLLQPFANGAANRAAGGPIDLFAALLDGIHRKFRFAFVAGYEHQVISAGIVSPANGLHGLIVKIE